MALEVELKLRLTPHMAQRLPRQPVLRGVTPTTYLLHNVYYDTPELDLLRRGVGLRLRRKGADWLMTVKEEGSASGGLGRRREWEVATAPDVFDFDAIDDHDVRDFLVAQRPLLQPVFTTHFRRTAWQLRRVGATVELALDRGHIAAVSAFGGPVAALSGASSGNVKSTAMGLAGVPAAQAPICEVELELVEGDNVDALFDIAIELAQSLHLHPEIASKAERGYALAGKSGHVVAKAEVSPVSKDMDVIAAFRAIALTCVRHLQRNEAGALAGAGPEFIHQARVAIRRLRSALKLFEPVLPPGFVETYSPRWRNVASSLGGARDWDVFLEETLAPLEDAFPDDPDLARIRARGEAAQRAAQRSVGKVLHRVDYSRLLLAFTAGLFRLSAEDGADPVIARSSVGDFAARSLRRKSRQVARLAAAHEAMDAPTRHQLRIRFKRLRYALDFFTPILPPKRGLAYRVSLAEIQEVLGKLNDLATASRLLHEMHPGNGPSPLSLGWVAGRSALLIETLKRELENLALLKTPWRRPRKRRETSGR